MIIREIESKVVITEANIAKKITDPNMKRRLARAIMHDDTIPYNQLGRLGKNPNEGQAVKFFSDSLDQALSNTQYGNIANTNKYDMWILKHYLNGAIDYEDFNGEADTLGLHYALGIRNLLRPEHRDINKFPSIQKLGTILSNTYYNEIARLKDEEKLKQMKKDKKDVILINDENVFVSVPLSYASCYYFNNAFGKVATYCTGSSSTHWFGNYARQGIIIDILNKKNPNEELSKFQLHAPTNQIKSATQQHSTSTDAVFAKTYPGLLKKITEAMLEKAPKIQELSQDIFSGGYDIPKEITKLKNAFPLSYNSKDPDETVEEADVRRTDNHDEWANLVLEVSRRVYSGLHELEESNGPGNSTYDVVFATGEENTPVFAAFKHTPNQDGSPRGIVNMNGQDLGINFEF